MEKQINKKTLRLRTFLVFTLILLAALGCMHLLHSYQEKEEKLKASYTAEFTIRRIESQLNRYLAESDLMKRLLESDYEINEEQFSILSEMMQDDAHVIEVHELAQDGIVSMVYPVSGNEEAIGLDMLQHPARKKEANLAKESGEYTIAGPFELAQGGTGVLLFNPIYITDDTNRSSFWGFSILVINWERFLEEIHMDGLEEASFEYRIWKKDMTTGEKITIAQSSSHMSSNTLEVSCTVPNDTWYFEIAPIHGWVTRAQIWFGILIAFVLAGVISTGYFQYATRHYKDYLYAERIKRIAKEASEANEAKTRFLFNMSHDIRTPLNAIIGYASLMEQHIDDRERSLNYLQKILSSSSLLLSLINYVLEMARIESGKMELKSEVGYFPDLITSLQAVSEPQGQKKHLQIDWNTDLQHNYIICDRTKIREIFLNIISNAIKYTDESGKVTISLKEIAAEQEGYAAYEFVVEDNGIGMSEDYLPHIFEEFSRERSSTESKVTGAGLGLPIVKSLVEMMGGSIYVKSKPNEGTRFTIRICFALPTEKQIQKKQEQLHTEYLEILKNKRILLAEDNDLNAEITETLLEEQQLKVERVGDGKECLRTLQEMPEEYYDMILMDIQMPVMNGYEAVKAIRQLPGKRGSIPVVALTANAFEEDRKKALDAGMNAHIAKPLNMEQLLLTMGEILSDCIFS